MLVMFTALRHTPGMKKENGFTLIETLVAVSLVVILSASGLYGWDSWQRHQRLWQTASQVRDYLLFLRNHANRHNRDHQITRQRVGDRDCLVSSAVQGCEKDSPFVLLPLWPEVAIGEVTPSLGFYGVRDTGERRKKTGAKEHRLCQALPHQIATGALMPGCGS